MKKIAGLLLAVLMLAALCVPALAAEEVQLIEISDGKTYTINSDIEMSGTCSQIIMGSNSTLHITNGSFLTSSEAMIFHAHAFNQKIILDEGCGLYLSFAGSANAFCKVLADSGIFYNRIGSSVQAGTCRHIPANPGDCKLCGHTIPGGTGSILSEGSLTIICTVAAFVLGLGVMFFIMKKKKPALASGENKDEE